MKAPLSRSATILVLLVLLWASPWYKLYVGGPGNYDVTTWGLYDWAEERQPQASIFRQISPEPTRSVKGLGLTLTVIATVGLLCFGAPWVGSTRASPRNQLRWGLLALGTVAACWVVYVWWPTPVVLANGDSSVYSFRRGLYSYLNEIIQVQGGYIPPDYPADHQIAARSFRLNWLGTAISLALSVVPLAIAFWTARIVTRFGLTRPGN